MTRFALVPTLCAAVAAALPTHATCYADYKAKRDNPLQLHYGVVQISTTACGDTSAAEREVRPRIAAGGWELLNVVSTFDRAGLEQRRDSAGEFFLRF